MLDIDTSALERSGYVILEDLPHRREIDGFETEIVRFSEPQLHKLVLCPANSWTISWLQNMVAHAFERACP